GDAHPPTPDARCGARPRDGGATRGGGAHGAQRVPADDHTPGAGGTPVGDLVGTGPCPAHPAPLGRLTRGRGAAPFDGGLTPARRSRRRPPTAAPPSRSPIRGPHCRAPTPGTGGSR